MTTGQYARDERRLFWNACQEDEPVLRNASYTAMNRRPKTRRGRRNFTLDELLTDAESGLTEEAGPEFVCEIGKPFGDANNSKARASGVKQQSRDN
jgi:hypothetical protein